MMPSTRHRNRANGVCATPLIPRANRSPRRVIEVT